MGGCDLSFLAHHLAICSRPPSSSGAHSHFSDGRVGRSCPGGGWGVYGHLDLWQLPLGKSSPHLSFQVFPAQDCRPKYLFKLKVLFKGYLGTFFFFFFKDLTVLVFPFKTNFSLKFLKSLGSAKFYINMALPETHFRRFTTKCGPLNTHINRHGDRALAEGCQGNQ